VARVDSPRNKVLYKFVRHCLNRTYLVLDDSQLSADEKYSLETVLNQIRQAEDEWRTLEDFMDFLNNELPRIYREALERLPGNIVDKLFEGTINSCMELEEVKSDESLLRTMKEVREKLAEARRSYSAEASRRVYEPGT